MITIENIPLDLSRIINEYPENSIGYEVLNLLSDSDNIHEYQSLGEMNFEIKMREEIVLAALALNESRMDFAIFREVRGNEVYWNITREGGYMLKSNVKPSKGITDIFLNGQLYATECATAMVIVYYKALVEVMGEAVFDQLFTKIHMMNWHYIDRRLTEIGYMQEVEDYLPGDRRYFANPDVDPKNPQWQGENVIDLSKKLYYGHGMGIKDSKNVIATLNRTRKPNATKSAYLMEKVGIPDFKSLYKLL